MDTEMEKISEQFFSELTYSTIEREAVWMEYEEEMEDFSLLSHIEPALVGEAGVFLCGYVSALDLEIAILAFPDQGKGRFFCAARSENAKLMTEEFLLSDTEEDFAVNMLLYTATTQIMTRERERAYQNLAQQKSGCAGCSGCGQ